jgi:hypothetical protein
MAAPTIKRGSDHFFVTTYEGTGAGRKVGKFVPFTNNGTIAKSCIFHDGDTPELHRTPSGAGNRDIFTLSFWIKRCSNLDALQIIFQHGADVNNCTQLSFDSSNRLQYQQVDGGGNTDSLVTNRSFEDTSKFYHIVLAVDTTQSTEANRVRMYVDGDEITSWSTANYPSQNTDTDMNTTTEFSIGRQLGATTAYSPDCYFAEVNYVDGTQYTPSTFGITDTSTGRWIPKALTGISYGTNGFRLEFANSAGQTIGDDTSGNGNDFTVSNITTTDLTTDSPTQNFITFDEDRYLGTQQITEEGGLTVYASSGSGYTGMAANKEIPQSGKWYWEVRLDAVGNVNGITNPTYGVIDLNIKDINEFSTGSPIHQQSGGMGGSYWSGFRFGSLYNSSGNDFTIGSGAAAEDDYFLFAFDMDNGKAWWGFNDSSAGSDVVWFANDGGTDGNPSTGANPTVTFNPKDHRFVPIQGFYAPGSGYSARYHFNFGQKTHAFTVPTGFSSLSQNNFAETGKGIPDLVWIKNRDQGDSHQLYDSSRGKHKEVHSDNTEAEGTITDGLQKFLKGGFEIEDNTQVNTLAESYVSWNWAANGGTTAANTDGSGASIASTTQANQTAGFSIVKYTGTGSAGTIAHGLGAVPTFISVKNLDDSASWYVYMNVTRSASPNTYYMRFDSDDSQTQTGAAWNDTTPTSSVFTVGGEDTTNKNTKKYIAYCWTDIPGYSLTGSFTGNGNANGSFVYTGFKPKLVMIKGLNIGNNWIVWDSERSKFNPCDDALYWDLSQAAATSGNDLDIYSNGFKCRGTNSNYNGSYIYGFLAFAENPFVGDGTNPTTAR